MQSLSLFFNFSPKKDNSSSSSQVSIDICTLPNLFMKGTLFDSFQKHAKHANLNVDFLSPKLYLEKLENINLHANLNFGIF